jgi:Mce-associated membrane protein
MATETLAAHTTETPDEALVAETTDTAETVEVKRRATAVRSAPAKRRATTSDSGTGTPRAASKAVSSGGPNRKNALLAAVIALLVAATGFFGYHYFTGADRADNPQTRAEVVSVANDYATKLSSFDYRDLNKNRKSITSMSTADFGKKYDEMVKALTEIVSNGKGVATAEVTNSAVESINGDKATVIAFVNQKARNVVAPDGKNQPYRMVVKLVRTDGTWLVDDVQTV